jgi:hypothetical protein
MAALDQHLGNSKLDAITVPGWLSFLEIRAAVWAVERNVPVVGVLETTGWEFARFLIAEALKRRLAVC